MQWVKIFSARPQGESNESALFRGRSLMNFDNNRVFVNWKTFFSAMALGASKISDFEQSQKQLMEKADG
jgi:hypothetical protein